MGGRGIISSICAVLILLMVIAFAYLPIRILRNASADGNRVARSHEVRKEIRDISEALRAVVYEHRSYVYSGDVSLRERRDRAPSRRD